MTLSLLFLLWAFSDTPVQTTEPTPAEVRLSAYTERETRVEQSKLDHLEYRIVGPRAMGARTVYVEGFPEHPDTYFAGYASGGLWRTDNKGVNWEPIFDGKAAITIGNVAVNPKNLDEIWLGTGEDNSSRSSYAGTGLYHTTDGGKTWTHKGLADSHHISKIIIHPNDPKTVYVAAIGHLYSTNEMRGVFKTTDGGETWQKILYINDNTGVIDLVIHPNNPDKLYAASWERIRKAWNFVEAGEGSAIYVTEDGGKNWQRSDQGLPVGEHMGRIGLSIYPKNPDIIYACVDNQSTYESPEDTDKLTSSKLNNMSQADLLALDDETIDDFLRASSFRKDYDAAYVREAIDKGEITIEDLRAYIYDGNADLFNRKIRGVELYRSEDGGKTWALTHEEPLEELAYSYGYYFGHVEVDPNDDQTLFLLGVPLLRSKDGGKTFVDLTKPNVHVDHHAIWIHPENSKHIINGNDGGINMTWDGGDNWTLHNFQPVGQFYTVTYDMSTPYNIYGGLQDNGVWYGPSTEQGRYDEAWTRHSGGDGAFIQVDPRDNATVYTGYQFGHYQRKNIHSGETHYIFPRHEMKEAPYRYNWMTPFVVSKHHPDIVYMAGNRVLRSLDQGEAWEAISPDLTTQPSQDGDVPFGTVTILRESPHEFGHLYAGTDDGLLWFSNGGEWQRIGQDIGNGQWVSSIDISPHDKGTVFVTFTGYRNDHFLAYLYRSDDFGKTWRSIKGDLPEEPVNVLRQDTKNPDVLYLGTDVGFWVSFDGGQHWQPHQANMPQVPVYAMEIHPREHELIIATHGRSIFVLDLEIISQLKPDSFEQELLTFDFEDVKFSKRWGRKISVFEAKKPEPPAISWWFFSKSGGKAELTVKHDGKVVHSHEFDAKAGLNQVKWDYQVTEDIKYKRKETPVKYYKGDNGNRYAIAGEYELQLEVASQQETAKLEITKPEK